MREKFASELPRLLYVADVPVESSYHGSALLYRLLQDYPPEKLRVLESSILPSKPERRLRHVPYARVATGYARPLQTRFARAYASWLTLLSRRRSRQVRAALGEFQPAAILTVTHGYLWDSAAQFGADHNLPLHLICHDDWPRLANPVPPLKGRIDRRFGEVYRQAASRFCVSPFMVEEYNRRYGVRGTLLYPSRAADSSDCNESSVGLKLSGRPTVAFAGTINNLGVVIALKSLARALDAIAGRLVIFGPFGLRDARREGLDMENVELLGLLPSQELTQRLVEEADVLFVPMSFDEKERSNVEISFPSKLADYTAVGLPLLIYGPAYSSAVRWAEENPGVAKVVANESSVELAQATKNLFEQSAQRRALGRRALDVGRRDFSWETAQRVFLEGIHQAA